MNEAPAALFERGIYSAAADRREAENCWVLNWSGQRDSNSRPPAPKFPVVHFRSFAEVRFSL